MYSPEGRSFCADCQQTARHTNKILDCESCEGGLPDLDYDTERLVECFIMGESQVRTGEYAIYGLDYGPIIVIAKSMGVVINHTFFRLLKVFENVLVSERNREMKRTMDSSKNKR